MYTVLAKDNAPPITVSTWQHDIGPAGARLEPIKREYKPQKIRRSAQLHLRKTYEVRMYVYNRGYPFQKQAHHTHTQKWASIYLGDGNGGSYDGPQVSPSDDQTEGRFGGLDVHGRVHEGPEKGYADAAERLNRTV